MKSFVLISLAIVLFRSCRNPSSDKPRLNQIQVISSHNSYKQAIESALLKVVNIYGSATAAELEYTHIPIRDQLDPGLKKLEIDVYAGSKGKFIFILDDSGRKRDLYLQGHSSLKERALFVNADPGTPEAAILIRNNPVDTDIIRLVKQGYIVRTRAEAGTKEARFNDYSRFGAAYKSGAWIITTDYYQKSSLFHSPYQVFFKDATYFRTNPLFNDKNESE